MVALAVGVVRGVVAAVLGGLVVALGTGCGERAEPTGAAVPLYPVTLRGAGDQPITLRAAPRRIAALAETPARIMAALGAGGRLAGGPGTAGERILDPNGHIIFERLQALRPDLLVASGTTDPIDLRRAVRATGSQVYVAPGNSIEDVERAVNELALLTGNPLAGRRIVGAIEARRRSVANRLAGRPPVRVFVDVGFFTTVPDGSLLGDLVREAGGRNVAGARPEPGPFDLGQLARLDPQVYLATSDSATTLRRLLGNPRTRRITAVRRRRFVTIPVELVQPGPRIGEGLEVVARGLHPDAFR